MSYILDALKKSEEERHQGQVPNLGSNSTLIHNPKAKRSLWPWAIAALLILNVFFVGFWVLKENREPSQAVVKSGDTVSTSTSTSTSAASSSIEMSKAVEVASVTGSDSHPMENLPSAQSVAQTLPPQVVPSQRVHTPVQPVETLNSQQFYMAQPDSAAEPVLQSELIVPAGEYQRRMAVEDSLVVEQEQEQAPLLITPKGKSRAYNGPAYKPEVRMPTTTRTTNSAAVTEETNSRKVESPTNMSAIERISDKPHSFQIQIPDMAFNSHIYTDTASSRRVMINNIYLREGQTFSGMRVEEITEEGIVLSLKGESFKMGVLRDWYSPR